MDDSHWAELGLTTDVLDELYRRGRQYAEKRIGPEHREDAVQDGMYEVLQEVLFPSENYPDDPEERLKYLTTVLFNEAMKRVTRRAPSDTNIPID